jgi:hypothetical protein
MYVKYYMTCPDATFVTIWMWINWIELNWIDTTCPQSKDYVVAKVPFCAIYVFITQPMSACYSNARWRRLWRNENLFTDILTFTGLIIYNHFTITTEYIYILQYSIYGRSAALTRLNTTFRGLAPSPSSGKTDLTHGSSVPCFSTCRGRENQTVSKCPNN